MYARHSLRVHVSGHINRARLVVNLAFCSINHSELTVVFATPEHIPALLKLASQCPTLKMAVSIDPLTEDTKKVLTAWGETVNIQVKELAECAWKIIASEPNAGTD